MKSNYPGFILLFLILLLNTNLPQSSKKVFKLEDLRKIVELSNPQVSPDGSQIAVLVSRPDWDNNKSKEEINLVNIKEGSIRSLTFKRESISGLSWSPDGSKLGFISKGPDSQKTQIYVMPMNGGDPIQITESKTGIKEFSWSPNGKKIAFIAQDSIPNLKEIKHGEDAFKVTDNNYLVRAEVQPWHLWIVSSEGGKAKQLTKGRFSLCTDQESISKIVWNKNGHSIIFQQFPDVWEGNAWHSKIAEVDTMGSEVKILIEDEGSSHPQFSPETDLLSFMRPRNGDQSNGDAVYIRMEGKKIDITSKLARNINNSLWFPDGKSILMTGEKGTHSVLWRQPIDGNSEQIDLDDVEIKSQSVSISNTGSIVFIGSTSAHPSELYYMSSLTEKPKKLTNLNIFADSLVLGKTVSVDWKGFDGFDEDGVLTYPVEYKIGEKYPLVLVIHGGPEGASTLQFSALPQLLSAKGFFVFQPNYRGSINQGDAYQHAIHRDTGEGPGKDVMAGLDKVLQLDVVDTNRIGISGWSYGGI
jgi:dipeptidyl aminopeptidase/acylaminoacyl peptidase